MIFTFVKIIFSSVEEQNRETSVAARIFKPQQISTAQSGLNVKTEEEAVNIVLNQFDTDICLSEITYKNAGKFDFENVFED